MTPLAATPLVAPFPGLVGGGQGLGGAPFVISALQAVTKVNVLSSPQILVTDNHPARLQVGSLVPYLTGSSQGTIVPNAPVVNSIDYRETGVITEVTPRVNSGGLVTLDISQEVSNIDPSVLRRRPASTRPPSSSDPSSPGLWCRTARRSAWRV